MGRRRLLLSGVAAVVLICPPAAQAVDLARRARLAVGLDRAVRSADRTTAGGIVRRTSAGLRTLVVRRDATLPALRRAAPDAVRHMAPGIWELTRTVLVTGRATLVIRSPVRELRLASSARGFSSVVATGRASLSFGTARGERLLVRSWDPARRHADRTLDDGRASVSVRGRGALRAMNTTFEDLGFYEGRVSGVAVATPNGHGHGTGSVSRSSFVHNYFGAYTYEAHDMRWVADRFVANVVYGLDPHDGSDRLVVEHSYAADNGRHGIIFSRRCDHAVIRDNLVERNRWHGIVLDDGKLADGPSRFAQVSGNLVRDNGRVGISLDGADESVIRHNIIRGGLVGIRLIGPSQRNRLTANLVTGTRRSGVLVRVPSQSNSIESNDVTSTPVGVAIAGAASTRVEGNRLEAIAGYALRIEPAGRGRPDGTQVVDNTLSGAGPEPLLIHGAREGAVVVRDNHVTWDYPFARDVGRIAAWVGAGGWVLVWTLVLAGRPLAFVLTPISSWQGASRRRRAPRTRLVAPRPVAAVPPRRAGVTASSIGRLRADWLALLSLAGFVAMAALVSRDRNAPTIARPPGVLNAMAPKPNLARVPHAGGPAALEPVRTLAGDGHPSHPTWYHDSQIAALPDRIIVAWNGRGRIVAAQLRPSDLRTVARRQVSIAPLRGRPDETGTRTTRHDVPTVLADGSGRLRFLYGGGSLSASARRPSGPYTRTSVIAGRIARLTRERKLNIGGGSAFDFEAVRERDGTLHAFGQRSRRDTGSLVELRWLADGRALAAREVIHGGFHRGGCVLAGRPAGCRRFAIARAAVDPVTNRLLLVWGYSEASLSNRCRTDAGYCDHDLYYAFSMDHGRTWRSADRHGAVAVQRAPIAADDRRFRLVAGHVGLFKAIAPTPSGALVVYGAVHGDREDLMALRVGAGSPTAAVVARAGTSSVKSWRGSLVLRGDGAGFTLWTPTGSRIFRFFSAEGRSWHGGVVYRGPAWSLTGVPAREPGRELLMWRGAVARGHSRVIIGAGSAQP